MLTRPESSESDRLRAVSILVSRGNQDAAALLRSLPADAPVPVVAEGAAGVTN